MHAGVCSTHPLFRRKDVITLPVYWWAQRVSSSQPQCLSKLPPPQHTSLSKLYTSSPAEAHMEVLATGLLLPIGLANNTPVGIASIQLCERSPEKVLEVTLQLRAYFQGLTLPPQQTTGKLVSRTGFYTAVMKTFPYLQSKMTRQTSSGSQSWVISTVRM